MRRFSIYGLIAIALGLLLAYLDIRFADSRYQTYRQLRIGMPVSEVTDLFRATQVQYVPVVGEGQICLYEFSDYFREYSVGTDKAGKVVVLRFQFNRRSSGLTRLWARAER